MKILAFGDSNTWGYDPKTGGRYDVYWTRLLQEKIPEAHIVNKGLCGRTTAFDDESRAGLNGLKALPDILCEKYDFAIIMLGTNDCKTAYNASAQLIGKYAALCLDELLKTIRAENVLLISPILLGESVYLKDREFDERSIETSKSLKAVYSILAKDKGTLFLAAEDFSAADSIDDEHLSREGHIKLAEAIFEKLRIYLHKEREFASLKNAGDSCEDNF